MSHPTEGVLRRLLDEPSGVADSDRRHAADCRQCRTDLAAMRADAALVDAVLMTEDTAGVDATAAWQRLSAAASAPRTARPATLPRTRRFRGVQRGPVVVGIAVAAVLAAAGVAAANDWLPIFRTERVVPVAFSTRDLNAVPDLSAYGDVVVTGEARVHDVADAAVAASATGLDVPEIARLPRGVVGEPRYQVGGEVSATFTFSAERAARAAARAGKTLPSPPPGLDGSQVRLLAGPGLAAIWSHSSGVPTLVVGRAVAPTAFSSGVPFDVVRDYLLSLPGLPDDVAAQLGAFDADGSTLPLPVPEDQIRTSSAPVNGVQATVLTTRDRTMAAVVWVDDGVLTAVAGPLDTSEVLSVARSLH